MSGNAEGINKARYWAFLLWIDSTPDLANDFGAWRQKLIDQHIPCVVSPMHDQDYDTDGEKQIPKKAHRHIMVQYGNVTTKNFIWKLVTVEMGFSTQAVVPIVSARGYYRYMIHLDNPEKAQYDATRYIYLSGFDPTDMQSDNDKDNEIIRISQIMKSVKSKSYKQFYFYLISKGLYAEAKTVQHNTYHFSTLAKGRTSDEE